MLSTSCAQWETTDAPFDKVLAALVREGVEAVASHDLSADHVCTLLLGVIVAACVLNVRGAMGGMDEMGHGRSGFNMPAIR